MRQAKRMFTQDHIAYLVNPLPLGEKWGFLPSGSANVFVANHDTEREGTSLTAKSPNNAYKLANIFMLANPYAFPTVYSGFDWTSTGQGADQESNGKLKQVQCGQNRWRCEHRKPEMKNMALFRKKSAGKAISNFMQGTTDQVGELQRCMSSSGVEGRG
jgi:alpha-amylase